MFDIGVPELAVIAIVALVVLGPERLPEVMKQAGKWYRQAMALRAELMSQVAEAQRTFREEIDAVERAATVDLATIAPPDPALPPPPLRQVPAYRRQPDKAQEAGPFGLAAWYRDPSPDVDIPALSLMGASPHSLRPMVSDPLMGHAYVTSTRILTAPIHEFDDPYDASINGSAGRVRARSISVTGPANRSHGAAVVPTPPEPVASAADDGARLAFEGTVITLFEAGMHSKETASRALEVTVAEFDRRLAARSETAVAV